MVDSPWDFDPAVIGKRDGMIIPYNPYHQQ